MTEREKFIKAQNNFINVTERYPKYYTFKSNFLLKLIEQSKENLQEKPFYQIIPCFIDDRINDDFLLENRGFLELSNFELIVKY